MRSERIAIDELVLRLPGVSKADAPALAERIMDAVATRLRGTGRVGRIDHARVRLQLTASMSPAELADRIADQLLEVLQ